MRLKAPAFWYEEPGATNLLSVFSCAYQTGHRLRHALAKPYKAKIPVICIGNITAGGSGKTPAALAVMQILKEIMPATNACFLTRGYGGSNKGPLMVADHTAREVGDEPLLLARMAPTIVSADRKAGAHFAEGNKHDMIVMDDGLQNPGLHKDLKLVVIDGATGFGNGKTLPAGPLREPVSSLQNADAFILIGEDRRNVRAQLPPGKPVFAATVEITAGWKADSGPYVAFCGIAHPEKFRATLEKARANVVSFHPYPDHYAFTAQDIEKLAAETKSSNARLITTAKDAVRLPPGFTADILPIELAWEDKDAVTAFLR